MSFLPQNSKILKSFSPNSLQEFLDYHVNSPTLQANALGGQQVDSLKPFGHVAETSQVTTGSRSKHCMTKSAKKNNERRFNFEADFVGIEPETRLWGTRGSEETKTLISLESLFQDEPKITLQNMAGLNASSCEHASRIQMR